MHVFKVKYFNPMGKYKKVVLHFRLESITPVLENFFYKKYKSKDLSRVISIKRLPEEE